MGARVGESEHPVRMLEKVFHPLLVHVEHVAVDERVHLAGEAMVEVPVEGVLPRLAREIADHPAHEIAVLGCSRFHDPHVVPLVIGKPERNSSRSRLRLDRVAERRVGHDPPELLGTLRLHGGAPGEKRLEGVRMRKAELHAEGEASDLPPELAAAALRVANLVELPEHALGVVGVHEHRGDHHGAAVAGGDLLEPGDGARHALRQHEHPLSDLAERPGKLEHLVLVGEP